MKDKIIEMLGNNVPATAVARACGVTDSYVSQIMADEGIRAQVTEKKIKNVEKGVKVDNLIEEIEESALERMKSLLPFISRPLDAARIFQTVNSAHKRTQELTGGQNQTTGAPLVNINISMEAATHFKLSSDKQVVEINGRSMATLPAKELNERLAERRASIPLISDATNAAQLLDRIESGIPSDSLAHVL